MTNFGVYGPSSGRTVRAQLKVLIADITLTNPGSFEAIAIPAGYEHLQVFALLRSSASAPGDGVYLQFNRDANNANYRSQASNTTNTTASGGYSDTARCGNATAASAPANTYGQNEYTIAFHALSYHMKNASCLAIDRRSSTDISSRHEVLNWESTEPITSVTLRTDNHPTDLFVAGSRVQVFGLGTFAVALAR